MGNTGGATHHSPQSDCELTLLFKTYLACYEMPRGDKHLVGMCETIQIAQNQGSILMENLAFYKTKENNLEDTQDFYNFYKVKTLMSVRSQQSLILNIALQNYQ